MSTGLSWRGDTKDGKAGIASGDSDAALPRPASPEPAASGSATRPHSHAGAGVAGTSVASAASHIDPSRQVVKEGKTTEYQVHDALSDSVKSLLWWQGSVRGSGNTNTVRLFMVNSIYNINKRELQSVRPTKKKTARAKTFSLPDGRVVIVSILHATWPRRHPAIKVHCSS